MTRDKTIKARFNDRTKEDVLRDFRELKAKHIDNNPNYKPTVMTVEDYWKEEEERKRLGKETMEEWKKRMDNQVKWNNLTNC